MVREAVPLLVPYAQLFAVTLAHAVVIGTLVQPQLVTFGVDACPRCDHDVSRRVCPLCEGGLNQHKCGQGGSRLQRDPAGMLNV